MPVGVSILTRPEGRVQQSLQVASPESQRVSILTRPEGRVQLQLNGVAYAIANAVSILTRPEGRVQRENQRKFNALRAVSILTRPEGRVQRDGNPMKVLARMGFNPHPSRRTGAT